MLLSQHDIFQYHLVIAIKRIGEFLKYPVIYNDIMLL